MRSGFGLRPVLQDDQRRPTVDADRDRGGCHQGPVRECLPARGYTHLLLEKGTVSSGARYDEILYLDKIADDLQNAAVTLLAGSIESIVITVNVMM